MDGAPAVAQPLLVRVAVLGDERADAFGTPSGDPEPNWCAIVEYVQGEALEAKCRCQPVHIGGEDGEGVAYRMPRLRGGMISYARFSSASRTASPAITVPISQRCIKSQVGRVPRNAAIVPSANSSNGLGDGSVTQ